MTMNSHKPTSKFSAIILLLVITVSLSFFPLAVKAEGLEERFLEKKEICPSLKFFFNDPKMKRYKVFDTNGTNFCPEVQKTCCTQQDFMALKNWWQINRIYDTSCTRKSIRKQRASAIVFYTKQILKNIRQFEYLANKILDLKQTASDSCQKAAKFFQEH